MLVQKCDDSVRLCFRRAGGIAKLTILVQLGLLYLGIIRSRFGTVVTLHKCRRKETFKWLRSEDEEGENGDPVGVFDLTDFA